MKTRILLLLLPVLSVPVAAAGAPGERQALLVPKTAIRETGQLTGIFVADSSSVARFRLVNSRQIPASLR